MPQVHGASKDSIMYVASVVEREINSVTDNPTIFMEDDLIISGGNFHGQPLAFGDGLPEYCFGRVRAVYPSGVLTG